MWSDGQEKCDEMICMCEKDKERESDWYNVKLYHFVCEVEERLCK